MSGVSASPERLEHLQSQWMPERLQLLGAVELEDLACRRRSFRAGHAVPILAAAGASRKTSTATGASRERLAGTAGEGASPNARATASALSPPDDDEDDSLRRLDRRQGERDAFDPGLESRRPGGRAAVGHLELRRAGEERGHVPVRPEAEQQEVELDPRERVVELVCGRLRRELAADAVHLEWRYREPREQRSLSEQEVRELVVGWHTAVVAPPDRRCGSSRVGARPPARRPARAPTRP